MLRYPFTFYRGSALGMAADLAATPSTGLRVQCCGDAHLLNFGGFATPERRVIFSINDLDETLPGPWEWDVKRLAASFVLACRDNKLGESIALRAARLCVRAYRKRLADFSRMQSLELWYYSLDLEELVSRLPGALRKRASSASRRNAVAPWPRTSSPNWPKFLVNPFGSKTNCRPSFTCRTIPPGRSVRSFATPSPSIVKLWCQPTNDC